MKAATAIYLRYMAVVPIARGHLDKLARYFGWDGWCLVVADAYYLHVQVAMMVCNYQFMRVPILNIRFWKPPRNRGR